MFPKYKIEIWEPGGGSALHTLEDQVTNIYVKHAMTDEIGSFSFTVPQGLAETTYNDIALHDIAKIWLDYDTLPANPDFIGRISNVTGNAAEQFSGKVFSGLDQGEILFRVLKGNAHWVNYPASDMVADLADDLGIYHSADIDSVSTEVTIRTAGEIYFDLLRQVSDYWYSGAVKVQKDFFVPIDGHLHWKGRPIRKHPDDPVEAFEIDTNIINYETTRDMTSVKNVIGVYGSNTKTNPADGDSWTESTTGWTVTDGGSVTADTDRITGDYSVRGYIASHTGFFTLKKTITAESVLYQRDPKFLHFWIKVSLGAANGNLTLRLLAPDTNNWFRYKDTLNIISEDEWLEYRIPVGEGINEWTIQANANWANIQAVEFNTFSGGGGSHDIRVDGLYFGGEYFFGVATTSPSLDDTRNLLVVDQKLLSDTECSKRAEALLMQYKDPITQITLTTEGNTNVKIGDRVPVTIPSEGFSASLFDVLTAEHFLNINGFKTKVTMTDSEVNRMAIPRTERDLIANIQKTLNTIGKGVDVI